MALRRSLLRIDTASLLETFGSLKIRNFGHTPSCLQLLRKSMSNFNLFHFNFTFLDIFKFEKLKEEPTLKREASLQRFLHKLKQKNFFTKMNMINCILLVLLLLVFTVLLKCTNSHLVIYILNFI